MVYSRSFCHYLHWCLEPVSKVLHRGGGGVGGSDCHIWDIKETRPNGSIGKAFCICLGWSQCIGICLVTMHLLSPVTAPDMEVLQYMMFRSCHSFCSNAGTVIHRVRVLVAA